MRTVHLPVILFNSGSAVTAPDITTTSLATATYGQAVNWTIEATGTAPITYSVSAGSLPAGLSLNASTGAITGTLTIPSTEQTTTSTTANFTIQATNAAGSDTQAFTPTLQHTFVSYTTMLSNAGILLGGWRNNLSSGTTVTNYGSAGTSLNGTLTLGSGAIGRTGQLGAGEAVQFDGAAASGTVINCGNDASVQGLTTFMLFVIVNVTGAGGNNAARFMEKGGEWSLRFSSSSRDITATVFATADGNSSALSNETLQTGVWRSIGLIFDNADRLIKLYVNGSELTYASRSAGGSTRTSNTNAITLGNVTGRTVTLAGDMDEAAVLNSTNSAHMSNMHTLAFS